MFKFAWKKVNTSNHTDTDLSSDSEISENHNEDTDNETDDCEDSDDWWPDL